MSERNQYPAGVPCWVETFQPDVDAAVKFYCDVFGWESVGPGPLGDGGRYYVARLRGLDVAGIGSQPSPDVPTSWLTSIAVANVDDAVASAVEAGGSVVMGPLDAAPAGRSAVVADPLGAVHGLWDRGTRAGARLVNEPGAWAMSQLRTPNPAGAADFYAAAHGWTTETFGEGDGAATMFRLPGYVGGLPEQPVSREVVATMVHGRGPAQWSPNFWVPDADSVEKLTAERGGRTVVPAFRTPAGTTVVLLDPQGALFSVTEVRRKG
ncbi:putative enzyme related to lactoylglutathione lyase [Arthrobacter stackebrandtii]|uniref:Enzyme related to lactoylglutathione lyase n=1 Tax=Arthrobacter stackebrandtii TaxID=272161 RepID=A0ABS4YW59_9MICC|nr:VOC family protein [Arthrobacter stackebrandtii]MBP2412183.1 putative enzyme related to lactoylglutathione lyase [Arthrobacter stackebrandtii]PYH01975.1 VOC family protein [Arthrobacter stackebrandtii]